MKSSGERVIHWNTISAKEGLTKYIAAHLRWDLTWDVHMQVSRYIDDNVSGLIDDQLIEMIDALEMCNENCQK